MAELPIDGPLEATEKLSCIQEILDRSLPAAPVMPEIQPAERELASLSEAELVARATELLTGLAQPPSADRKPGSSYSPRRSLGGCLCRARPEAARVVLLSFVPSESVRGVSADACKSS